jgi:hypothetical protein
VVTQPAQPPITVIAATIATPGPIEPASTPKIRCKRHCMPGARKIPNKSPAPAPQNARMYLVFESIALVSVAIQSSTNISTISTEASLAKGRRFPVSRKPARRYSAPAAWL